MAKDKLEMPKVFTVTKKGSGEVVAIIDTIGGSVIAKEGYEILTENDVKDYSFDGNKMKTVVLTSEDGQKYALIEPAKKES